MKLRTAVILALATLVTLAALGGRSKTVEAKTVVIDDVTNEITFTDLHVTDQVVFEARLANIGDTRLDGLSGAVFLRAVPGEFGIDDFLCEWSALGYRPCDHIWKPTNYPGYQAEMIIGPGDLSLSPSASIFTLVRITANADHGKVEAKVAIFQDTGTVSDQYDASDIIVSDGDSPVRLELSSQGPEEQRALNLSSGCNMATLTFTTGTEAATVAGAVSPPDALESIWRLDNSTGSFQAYVAAAPGASDLQSVNLLDAVYLCVSTTADISMPAVSPDPSATISTSLGAGCNVVGLSFPDGTDPSEVADALTPAGAFESMWRLDNITGFFQAYMAAAPEVSDLTSLQFLDAVFICTAAPGDLEMPGVTEPAPGAVARPPRDIRFVMEAAVPQIVDLPGHFVAIEENFERFDPPGLLYFYEINCGSILGLIGAPPGTLVFVSFDLYLYDTVGNAKVDMSGFTSFSAEEWKADLEPEFAGSLGLEIGSLTLQEVEPPPALGDEADWRRLRVRTRRVHSNDFFVPESLDIITFRRDRVLGQVFVAWSPGPPGAKFIPENLAEIMDAGIQEALPELLAAVP